MDKPPALDWSLIRSFLTVAETGSLSAAARRLGLSQPSLGRHIRAAETALQVALFARQPRGLALTEAGQALLPAAQEMRAAAARLALAAAARSESLTGTVRLTASRIVSHHILPPILARLRASEPGIAIELVASDASENLLFREADIALRMYRPTQGDLLARHVCDLPIALYAAHSYLARRGTPQNRDELLALDFVGYDTSDMILRLMAGLGAPVGRDFFGLRCDDQLVYWNLVRAGCGVGGMQRLIGDADPLVARIDGIVALPALPLWLAATPAMQATPRQRLVWDFLANALENQGAA
ncbi:MAG: LysR family transcriptional regulator [Pseudorhodobacter sp.]|nr:LysR family transcriptional regulator [Pseudorhodobacter sp.]